MADFERIRLVILGGAGVGKSSIVKRFLFKTYNDKYRATVEDLYNREYDLGSVTLKVSNFNFFFKFLRKFSFVLCFCSFMLFILVSGVPYPQSKRLPLSSAQTVFFN